MTNKRPIDRFESRKMPGICIFCLDADECYSTPRKCREQGKVDRMKLAGEAP